MKSIVVVENVRGLIESYGIERCVFLTLTFPDSVVDSKEASRRFNSFRQGLAKCGMLEYISVQERHRSGAIHYHLVAAWAFDVRGRLSDKQIYKRLWASAPSSLRKLWADLRVVAAKYGFGRINCLPLGGNGVSCGYYLAKYLSKQTRSPLDKGVRLVRFGLRTRYASSKITSINSKFRKACVLLFGNIDVKSYLGNKWAYLMQPAIQFAIDSMNNLRSLTQRHIDTVRSYVYYGSKLFSFTGFRTRLYSSLFGV